VTKRIVAAGKRVEIQMVGDRRGPLILLNSDRGEGQAVFDELPRLTRRDFVLASIEGLDWNGELSPWPSAAVFRGGEAFAGGGGEYLRALEGEILPAVEEALPGEPTARVLAGYSLAGLFALYGLHRSTRFDGAVSASGSLWYPGFLDYARENAPAAAPRAIYLSVGDREARTRNPVMATVEENTARLAALYRERGVETRFELNPGNHFQEPALRTARGVAWMLERL